MASERIKCQLFEQGLVPEARINVVKNDIGGPLVVSVKETRLALGRGIAMQILVEECLAPNIFNPELVFTNISGKATVEK
jgi:ferrous iron transport protein A